MTNDRLKDLTALATQVAEIYRARFDAPGSTEFVLLKLTEELGELTGAWLQSQGQGRGSATASDVENELADVLGFLLVFAAKEGIDPATALRQKWGRYAPKTRTTIDEQ